MPSTSFDKNGQGTAEMAVDVIGSLFDAGLTGSARRHPAAPRVAMVGWSATAWQDFLGLSAAIAMVGLALGMVLPLCALNLDQAGYSTTLIGALLAIHALGLILAMPLTTPVVTRWGARKVLQHASMSAALACALLYAAQSAWALALGLLLLGILLGLVFNLVETWVNEILPDGQRGRWLAVHCTVVRRETGKE